MMRRLGAKLWLAVAFVAALTFAPAALAHESYDHRDQAAAAGASAQDVAPEAIQSAYAKADLGRECPEGGEGGHAGHPGCCAGISHCAAGCGAATIATTAALPPPLSDIAAINDPLLAAGIVSDPTDPPPRSFL